MSVLKTETKVQQVRFLLGSFTFKSGGVMVAYKVHALVILVQFQASQLIIDQR